MPDPLTIVAVAAAAAWLLYKAWRRRSRHRSDLDWLPAELCDAELVWSEKAFRCHDPARVAVRIDRAYRAPDGELFLIEFKRRPVRRVYRSDIVELSVQRHVLEEAGHVVSRRAYVAVILPNGLISRALAVQLEDAELVRRRITRLIALVETRAYPHAPTNPAVCAGCGHSVSCPRSRKRPGEVAESSARRLP
jgi:hypothetical protein